MKKDTIAAIATSLSDAGIGIIRIAGSESIEIAHRLFVNKNGNHCFNQYKSHTIHYGYIIDCFSDAENFEDCIVDEVMIAIMKKPNSYTKEDTVEINCHGGVLLLQKVLELAVKCGARIAEPGEFTKRAFLNGRIDLAKAEAVMDLIHSQNEFALKSSVNQLKGNVSKIIYELREKIIYEIAFIESALDDPEHISLDGYEDRLNEIVIYVKDKVKDLIESADNGKMMKEGINTVIVGKPNAGKSSLLNHMLGEERAIVTDIAGTTRDVLQETIRLRGISLNMIDTAGIRNTEDIVEKIGVEKAKEFASKADLILYVVDTSIPLDESDRDIISVIQDKKVIVLLNKSDLKPQVTDEEISDLFGNRDINLVRTSTKENTGLDIFEDIIQNMFFSGQIKSNQEVVITNMRHKEALMEAYESLQMVKNSLELHMPEDFYSIDLMSAYASLGKIIGEEVDEDLVNEIFTKFCMGK